MFLLKNWFFLGVIAVIIISFVLPDIGILFREYKILNLGIFLAFFITGLSLETTGIRSQLLSYKPLVAAVLSSLFFFPLIAKILAEITLSREFMIGVCIIAVAPVTVASGVVLTSIGRGNVALALLICIIVNLLAIFTIPISLNLLLGFEGEINLPIFSMFISLLTIVLIPTVIGQILRPFVIQKIAKLKKFFSVFQQVVVLLIIFNAFSSSTTKIMEAGTLLIKVAVFTIFLHLLILLMNYGISKIIRLDRPSTTAFTIQTSQKTLTVSYVVWAGYFAIPYPMAMIPGIIYHLVQMIMDTIIAERFRLADIRAKDSI